MLIRIYHIWHDILSQQSHKRMYTQTLERWGKFADGKIKLTEKYYGYCEIAAKISNINVGENGVA